MKFVHQVSERGHPRIPARGMPVVVIKSLREPGQFYSPDGKNVVSTCLNCPDQPCIQFSAGELGSASGLRQADVCPVSAISFGAGNTELHITSECVHCGLCVTRCPYRCLYLDDSLTPTMVDIAPGLFTEADEPDFELFDKELKTMAGTGADPTIEGLLKRLGRLEQAEFYPLVANLLTAIGLPTMLTRQGDTSNRLDGLIPDTKHSIPVEIKSPAESRAANIKSVQQALENKVVLMSRHAGSFPTTLDTTSFVVAYEYPSERSDVLELTRDIYKAYGVRVGLIDAATLLRYALDVPDGAALKKVRHLLGAL